MGQVLGGAVEEGAAGTRALLLTDAEATREAEIAVPDGKTPVEKPVGKVTPVELDAGEVPFVGRVAGTVRRRWHPPVEGA